MHEKASYKLQNKRVWVAGHRGLVGSALVRRLASEGCEILVAPRDRVDLRSREPLDRWLSDARPEAVFLAAARVGGIHANDSRPADFIYDNLMIEANVVAAAREHGVEKLMLLGSSCIYPRLAEQPMRETALLSGPLEPTNQWYAVAKIAGIMLGQAFRRQYGMDVIAVMPTNLYGPHDNFDLLSSHVMPALIAKAHAAKQQRAPALDVWGTGQAIREFLYVDDAADAMVFLMKHYSNEAIVNLGTGEGISIADLAASVCRAVGFSGGIRYDSSKPDGTPCKIVDVSRLHALGWRHRTSLAEGIEKTYAWYVEQLESNKERARFAHR
jgi:GDP-L-fucose synthase